MMLSICPAIKLILVDSPPGGIGEDVFDGGIIFPVNADDPVEISALPHAFPRCSAHRVDLFGRVHFEISDDEGNGHDPAFLS